MCVCVCVCVCYRKVLLVSLLVLLAQADLDSNGENPADHMSRLL